ncbi:MAG: aldo/keto reductase, partial [Clostridia bacterium]|nr:aldo/keto reductase [Clostridia bacterium]
MMRYGKIEGVDKPISRIILGGSSGCFWQGQNCDELLDFAFASGVNTFDTARGYNKSEAVLGDWLERRGLRDKVVIQTKGALHGLLGNNRVKEKCIRADLQKSLTALKLPYVDVYLLHRDNPKTDVGWIVELLNEFRAEGKIKAFGGSNWHHTRIEQVNEYAYKHNLKPFTVSQPQFSLAEVQRWVWIGCVSVSGPKNADAQYWYARTGFPLTAFSS